MNKKFYTMKDLADIIPIGTTNLYNLVHSEGFTAIMINRKIVVPVEEFDKWVKSATGKKLIVR